MYDVETLLATLSGYCKWPTLPRQLLLDTLTAWTKNAAGSVPSSEATDEVVLEAFLQALSSAVPLEWSVSHHAAFTANTLQQTDQNAQQWQQQRHTKQQVDNRTQTQQQQASMHSQAVGTPYGIMTFGGLELGKLTELKVKSEVSWIKEHNGYMLQPDFSRVYQVGEAVVNSRLDRHILLKITAQRPIQQKASTAVGVLCCYHCWPCCGSSERVRGEPSSAAW